MYCGHCGAELKPGDKMCPKCGYLVLDTQQSSEPQEVLSSITISEIASPQEGTASENPMEEKKRIQSATKFKLMLVIAMACFFFPFTTVSCAGEDITASGYEIMTATSLSDKDEISFTDFRYVDIKPNVYLIVSFLMGAVGIALARKGKPLKIPFFFSVGGTIFLILFRTNFYSFYSVEEYRSLFSAKFRWGWLVALLFFGEAMSVALDECINNPQITKKTQYIMRGISYLLGGIVSILLIANVWSFLNKTISDNRDMPRGSEQAAENWEYFPDVDSDKESSDIIANDIIPIELCRAYSSNPVAADKQYANQRLNVQGEIASITPSPFDDTVSVSLSYANTESLEDFTIFMAYFEFSASNEGLYDLEVGKTATLSGVLEPDGGGMFIHFSDATLYGQALPDNTEGGSTGVQDVSSGTESSITFDTEFYSLEFPDYWEDLSVYDQWDIDPYSYGITFYENQSLDDSDGDGGVLFSIALYSDEDYIDYPSYTYLGQLSVVRLATYDVVVIYPTDVQFSDAGQETYMKLSNDIDGILASFTPQPDVDCEYIPAN